MTEHTKVVAAYAPPAIERREGVTGLLTGQHGSYGPPTYHHKKRKRKHRHR